MRHNICLIDNTIPANLYPDFIKETKILDESILKYLVLNSEWDEPPVKGVVEKLLDDSDNWKVSAFKDPSFYLSHCEEEVFNPEIILYDWDYGQGPGSDKAETDLLAILETTYAIVHIFTNADSQDGVTNVIAKDEFEPYRERLKLFKKDEDNSIEALLASATERYNSNFSYRFGKEVKLNANKALENIFIEISKLSIDQFVAYFGSTAPNNKSKISTNSLVSIIAEKFKHELVKQDFLKTEEVVNTRVDSTNDTLIRKIWSYRLYYRPNDNIVRRGDIIKKRDNNLLFLVLSSDCHMNQFWNKNFGHVSLVPLYKLNPNDAAVMAKFDACNANKIKDFKLTSLTNPTIDGITVLPGVKDFDSDNFSDYLLVPKEIFTERIELPALPNINNLKQNLRLLYDYWTDIENEYTISISEPFKSPLMQFIMENITGYGCPDFPPYLQTIIKNGFVSANGKAN